ncbi:Rgg/GadR/MutR family transcriptional regulator [Streptococcus thermophilus]|mgnify:FL=1|nr:Rgg/GadR/MutR family transcriptional regulator [Streptococcus thermophilus]
MGKQNELKKIGEIYRELRLDKGTKLSNYIDKGFSKSQLSRFERGETEISLIKFLSALDFINVSIEEFMVIYRGYRNDSFEELLKKLHTLSLTKDAEGLRYLFNEVEELPNSTTKKIEKILILSCLSSVESENLITQSDLRFVTDYLFGIESWGYYELSILGNLAQYINGETLVSLGREVLRKTDYYYEVVRNRKLVIQLSINIMIRCIESEWFTKAAFLRGI